LPVSTAELSTRPETAFLAEFGSVLNAVKCAIAVQQTMVERNASVAPDRRMEFRIGINQGDVLFDDERIFGDGINVAARGIV
jgi:adenylate cyclase